MFSAAAGLCKENIHIFQSITSYNMGTSLNQHDESTTVQVHCGFTYAKLEWTMWTQKIQLIANESLEMI